MTDQGEHVADTGPVLITAQQALATTDAVFLDCRAGADAESSFLKEHVPGATFVDLESDLARVGEPSAGGRHPLPSASDFSILMGSWGITEQTPVFVYDASSGAMAAARAWWMLRSIGHASTSIVDGGWLALKDALGEIEVEPESGRGIDSASRAPGWPYPKREWLWPTVDIDEVEIARGDDQWVVIDVRSEDRFAGRVEPFDPVPGRIPGARNLPYEDLLDDEGLFLDPVNIRRTVRQRSGGIGPQRTIVHCGSGVTACHTLAAMEHAGLSGASLYVGSYSEWCRNDRAILVESDSS